LPLNIIRIENTSIERSALLLIIHN